MNGSSRLLDFFALEAAEYLNRLERAIAGGSADIAELGAGARGLRGSATMARSTPIANLAGRLETIAQKISGGQLSFDGELRRVIAAAVETLAVLVRSVRTWAPEHTERARRALDELDSFVPGGEVRNEDVIVPISELFYSDAGPHVIEVAASARTTFEQRLREKQPRPAAPAFPAQSARTPQTPVGTGLRGAALRDALGSSLAEMRPLERPGEPEPEVVPIQNLLYRGKSAVDRSKELRAQIFAAKTAPTRESIAELCDLVELAGAE
jgi:chemotaxis protein histidine kinase CheA